MDYDINNGGYAPFFITLVVNNQCDVLKGHEPIGFENHKAIQEYMNN
jgi:hypothetical protein